MQMRNRTVMVGLAAALLDEHRCCPFEAVTLADYSGEEIFLKYCSACHGESGARRRAGGAQPSDGGAGSHGASAAVTANFRRC